MLQGLEKQRIGIDFGTTNSLISLVSRDVKIKSFDIFGRPHPSVVTYEGDRIICGKSARDKLSTRIIGVLGNTVRGPKKLISSEVINVDGRLMSPIEVISDYMSYLVEHARKYDTENIADLTRAVVTIPVALDGRGRKAFRNALLNIGVHVDLFIHEPLAALYGYFRGHDNFEEMLRSYEGKLLLVFDWGGGTLDLTLCKIINGALVQVLNRGNNLVGGDYLDEAILKYVLDKHAQKHDWTVDSLPSENPGMRARLLLECERAKIELSDKNETSIFLPEYYPGEDENSEIDEWLDKETLQNICSNTIEKGINEIHSLLSQDNANIDSQTIALCLATGGMVNMPFIKASLTEIFGISALNIAERGDRIISEGAAWIAYDNPVISLAKPFELVEARNSLLTIIQQGTALPERGHSIQAKQSMYCSDPRDGKAIFSFKRPQMVDKNAAADPRTSYGNLSVEVNPEFPPLEERIELNVTIDDNLIAHVDITAADQQVTSSFEIYDLEFALDTKAKKQQGVKKNSRSRVKVSSPRGNANQLIARANISASNQSWDLVPGELMKEHNDKNKYLRVPMTEIQNTEHARYLPCANCGARWTKNCCTPA